MAGSKEESKKGVSKQTVILIIVLVIVIGAAAAVIVYLLTREPEAPPPPDRIVTEANLVDITQEVNQRVEEGSFETHMNTIWTFPDGESASIDAVMGNPSANRYAFYFTVTLSTGELVYTSGVMPVGTRLGELILDEPLEAGTYTATVGIQMVEEDGTPRVSGNMGIEVTLVIQS